MHPAVIAAAGATTAAGVATAFAVWRKRLGAPPASLPPVLAYHKVGTPELGGTWCTTSQFASHLETLHAHGFTAIDVATFAERVACAQRASATHTEVPSGPRAGDGMDAASTSRSVLLTFDDAFESFATHAWPQLAARRMPVLLFVIADYVGRRAGWDLPLPGRRAPHLSWSALRDLVAQGVAIGSHTLTHRDPRALDDATLTRELQGSRDKLEDALGVAVRTISYPFGRSDERTRAAAAAAGYELGFSMCPRWSNCRIEPLALRRWGVYVSDSPRTLLDKLDPKRRGFWVQDLTTRAINAVAGISVAASRARA